MDISPHLEQVVVLFTTMSTDTPKSSNSNTCLNQFPQHLRNQLLLVLELLHVLDILLLKLQIPVDELVLVHPLSGLSFDLHQVHDDQALQLHVLVVTDDHTPLWLRWRLCESQFSTRTRRRTPCTRVRSG